MNKPAENPDRADRITRFCFLPLVRQTRRLELLHFMLEPAQSSHSLIFFTPLDHDLFQSIL